MKSNYYKKYIDYNTKRRADMSEIFENPEVFCSLISDLSILFRDIKFDKIAGMDALGFVLAGALALKLKKPLVLIRKEGKLPGLKKDISQISFLDYEKKKTMEVLKKSINKKDKILLIDEWIETGGQVSGVVKLIERIGGHVVGIGVINADEKGRQRLKKYNLRSVI